ncbi:MAG: phosphoglycerate dehydrogenase [Chloroflexota bacterium]
MLKILVSDKLGQAGLDILEAADDVHFEMKTGLSKDELMGIIGEYDALIVRSGTRPDADIIGAGKNLKIIGRAGAGVDNIDIKAATTHGIVVMNTPGANSMATAEQTMALMMAITRHTAHSHASVLAGEWKRSHYAGTELYQKTLGVIGFGRIGKLVTARAQGFGMQVIAYDPFVTEDVALELGVTLVDLDELYAQSDYITLHTAATPETEKMINKDAIGQMKDGVFILNVARGKLVNESDLAEGLKSGKVKAAGIDVYSKEPPENSPLIGLPNVVHTPHLGASTVEAQKTVAQMVVNQVINGLRGHGFKHAINLPMTAEVDFEQIRPYLTLAERIGKLQAGLATGKVTQVEIEASGNDVDNLIRPLAAGVLKGLLEDSQDEEVNYINAPILADEAGIEVSQATGMETADYSNRISCRVHSGKQVQLVAGVLFANEEPRIVQINEYQLEAKPEGHLLLMANKDVPGVIGQIGTLLAAYEVNIGEWRMGRHQPSGESLSVINLDSNPPIEALDAIKKIKAVTQADLISL